MEITPKDNKPKFDKGFWESSKGQTTQYAGNDLLRLLATEQTHTLSQCISDTFQSILDVFLTEQEKEIKNAKNMMIDRAKPFIDEYKKTKSTLNDLLYIIDSYRIGKEMVKKNNIESKRLKQIQNHINISLIKISDLHQGKQFSQNDQKSLKTFIDCQIKELETALETAQKAVKAVGEVDPSEKLSDYKEALEGYINTFFKDANEVKKKLTAVINEKNYKNLTQLQEDLAGLSPQINKQLSEAVQKDYEKALAYSQLHSEELQGIRTFEPVADFDTCLRQAENDPTKTTEKSSEIETFAHESSRVYKPPYEAVKSSKYELSNKLENLDEYLDARSKLKKALTDIKIKKTEADLYYRLSGKYELPKKLFKARDSAQIDSSIKQAKNFLGKEDATSEELLKMVQDLADQEIVLTEENKIFEKFLDKKGKSVQSLMDLRKVQKELKNQLDIERSIIEMKREIRKAALYNKFSEKFGLQEKIYDKEELKQIKLSIEKIDILLESEQKDPSKVLNALTKLKDQKVALSEQIKIFEGNMGRKLEDSGLPMKFKETWENFEARSGLESAIGKTEQCYDEVFAYWNKYKKEINKGSKQKDIHDFSFQLQKISHDLKAARRYMKTSESMDQDEIMTHELREKAQKLQADNEKLSQKFENFKVEKYLDARSKLESALEDIKETLEDAFSYFEIYEKYEKKFKEPPINRDNLTKLRKLIFEGDACLGNACLEEGEACEDTTLTDKLANPISSEELLRMSRKLAEHNTALSEKLEAFENSLNEGVRSKIKEDFAKKIDTIHKYHCDTVNYFYSKVVEISEVVGEKVENEIREDFLKIRENIDESLGYIESGAITTKGLLRRFRDLEAYDIGLPDKLKAFKQYDRYKREEYCVMLKELFSRWNTILGHL